jgi:hypothetical protein
MTVAILPQKGQSGIPPCWRFHAPREERTTAERLRPTFSPRNFSEANFAIYFVCRRYSRHLLPQSRPSARIAPTRQRIP